MSTTTIKVPVAGENLTHISPATEPKTVSPSWLKAFLIASRYNFVSFIKEPMNLSIALGIPLFMYFMFGVGRDYTSFNVGNGNVSAQILVSMTTYGVLVSLSSLGVNTALERANGWVRQIALTPLKLPGWVASKMVAGLGTAIIIVAVSFTVGYFAEAEMTTEAWIGTAIAAVICGAMAAPFGLAVSFLTKSDVSFGIVGALSSIFAFASGMFIPSDQMGSTMQKITEFMPYYGVNRIPLGFLFGLDQLTWKDWTSVIVWFVIFSGIAILAARRKTER